MTRRRNNSAAQGRKLPTLLLGTLLIASCTVGPNYKRPKVLVPSAWRNADDTGGSLADFGWW